MTHPMSHAMNHQKLMINQVSHAMNHLMNHYISKPCANKPCAQTIPLNDSSHDSLYMVCVFHK